MRYPVLTRGGYKVDTNYRYVISYPLLHNIESMLPCFQPRIVETKAFAALIGLMICVWAT